MDGLWGDFFSIPDTKETTKKIVSKIAREKNNKSSEMSVEKALKSKKVSLEEKLAMVEDKVVSVLSKQINNVAVITDRNALRRYIDRGLEFGRIAIDTETNNSLDPITCKLMGLCLYVKGEKQVYIPVNHIDRKTNERLPDQLTEQDIREELQRAIDSKGDCKFIFHNGKFDYEVLKCTCHIELPIDWDTLIGAKLLDENEPSYSLKWQYVHKIDPEQEKYDIEGLFEHLPYEVVEPRIFALYAATDAMMTDRLYELQMREYANPDLKDVLNLATTLEMPLVRVFAELELNGVDFDSDYQKRLSAKYHGILDEVDVKLQAELNNLKSKIDEWRKTPEANNKPTTKNGKTGKSKSEQLTDPINLSSPTQLAILLYDVLGVQAVDEKTPRGTGSDILEKIDLPICKLLTERKELEKLITAFIDALPTYRNVDGRIHCHFNQLGAATGRQSSSEPNLQQIPSHAKDIRLLFKASDGYTLVGSDYSQQEPRCLAAFADDDNMINAYKQGRDLYAIIAEGVYHNRYEDNLEHYPDGSINVGGAKRRSNCKSLLLGLMYGRGTASIAEQIHGTKKEAEEITDSFFNSFPKVKKWMDKTQRDARKNGYVTDLWGRRRHLPNILLPKYELKDNSGKTNSIFNPFLECEDRRIENGKIEVYREELKRARGRKQVETLQERARKDRIEIVDNSSIISRAERQCVNARIQGSAASMTKQAMLAIFSDEELNRLGFRLLITVHDELIGECPTENSTEVARRLEEVMMSAASSKCSVPFKCDADVSSRWYLNEYKALVEEEYDAKVKSGMSEQEAFDRECEERPEAERKTLYAILKERLSSVLSNA